MEWWSWLLIYIIYFNDAICIINILKCAYILLWKSVEQRWIYREGASKGGVWNANFCVIPHVAIFVERFEGEFK